MVAQSFSSGTLHGKPTAHILCAMDDLSFLANSPQPLPKRFSRANDGFSRGQVVEAFQRAFDMIGGVERLTLWAHENPGDFFRLYAKLLPATTVNLGDAGHYIIEHTIAPTALDNHDHKIIDVAIESMSPPQVAAILSQADDAGN